MGKNRVFNLVMETLGSHLFSPTLEAVSMTLKCATKLPISFGFVLKSLEKKSFWCYYEQENNTLLERWKHDAINEYLLRNNTLLIRPDSIEACSRERANTNWKFYNLSNITVSATRLIYMPLRCKDTVMPERLKRKHSVNCLIYNEYMRKPYIDILCILQI